MLAECPKVRALVCDFVEKFARILLGEPARIVRKSTLERLERLAYRGQLEEAARAGNTEFIEDEVLKNQLTARERHRLVRKHTPLAQWPDVDENLIEADLFDESPTPSARDPIMQ
ncbi:MAG: hypothetical protein JWN24_4591 [Phycisphaerales bacterium]|nr:hypothetical protein [Phycisphaerales bacterium]